MSIDGTGQFASNAISCEECCTKTVKGHTRYYHQLLGAVIVHRDLKTVLPLAPDAITRQDGASKNDCERNGATRLLTQLRQDYPQLKCLVVEDSLAANGPHLKHLQLCSDYVIPDWKTLWEAIATGYVPAVLAPDTS